MRAITSEEQQVLDLLGSAWNAFLKLEAIHPDDNPEFRAAIHAAQNIVLSRPAFEEQRTELKQPIVVHVDMCRGGDIKRIQHIVYESLQKVLQEGK